MSAGLWESVSELTKAAQEKGIDPRLWLRHLSSALSSAGVSLPSPELANLLVSHICWANNVPIAWKFLDKALNANLVPPMLVLALLSTRVIPSRNIHPAAYRLFLEFVRIHAFTLSSQINGLHHLKVMKSIIDALHLSPMFIIEINGLGMLVVGFVLSMMWQLLDASLDDEKLIKSEFGEKSRQSSSSHDMDIDGHRFDAKKIDCLDGTGKKNIVLAIEIIGEFIKNKATLRILYLVRRNMTSQWKGLSQHLRLLAAHSTVLRTSKHISPQALLLLTSDACKVLPIKRKTISKKPFYAIIASGPVNSSVGQFHGACSSVLWLPIDLFMEDSISNSKVMSRSAVDILTGLLKALQAVNNTTWHDTFLGVWISALRLVQRERDPIEAPVDRLSASLCMLLSITALAIANIIEEEDGKLTDKVGCSPSNQENLIQVPGQRRRDLISSLQLLGDYKGLLTPPLSLTSCTRKAAAKAMLFISGAVVEWENIDSANMSEMPTNYSGSLLHIIVEVCIARNLLDTSAYFWPGYVNGHKVHMAHSIPSPGFGWSAFMKGSPLTPLMVNALVSSPASCLEELEKVYNVAVNGSDDEKISAAKILCGASLMRGWNIQEHIVGFIAQLLSPPVPANYSGVDSHLIGLAPFLNVLIVGISSTDCVLIFSLHGLVPLLAGALMHICEVFGSCRSSFKWDLSMGDKISADAVFSNAFILLLRLWRFNHPPAEYVFSDQAPVGSAITPEFLLLLRNQLISSRNGKDQYRNRSAWRSSTHPASEPIFMESFPRLKSWYQQQQACIASTLGGLTPGSSVHQNVDGLLNMMFRKLNRTDQNLGYTSSGSSSSSGVAEDASLLLNLPAWDILEAVPFALDAAFTACAYDKLSPRELATGLRHLADFLPASAVTIISYLSAEVTRGVWKPAFMNGTDWPSPAANLSAVERKIKEFLNATGVDVPSLAAGENIKSVLPLALAAFISFTITYKIDRSVESALAMAGQALTDLAACSPWPCMPIVTALWSQKAKRWGDFLVLKAAGAVFHHNSDAVMQLLKICFSCLNLSSMSDTGGVGELLGHGLCRHSSGGSRPLAPGILFLGVYQYQSDLGFLTEGILSLIMLSMRETSTTGLPNEQEKLKQTKNGIKYRQVSISETMRQVKATASFGASLVWISGGLHLVQTLIRETLPSWFMSDHKWDSDGEDLCGVTEMLGGYALAYFAVLCWAFACGVDLTSLASTRLPGILNTHLEFLARVLEGKISLGCRCAIWKAYVSGFLGLMVECLPMWMLKVEVDVIKRLSKGLRQLNEEELALALLEAGGIGTMGAAVELIIESQI